MIRENIVLAMKGKDTELTNTEKVVADFFISNKDDIDFSAKNIASKLGVSKASLSRFSKKLDFNGYREFIYEYKLYQSKNSHKEENLTRDILDTYKELLLAAYRSIDNQQMIRIAKLISQYEKVHVYGIENTSFLALEFRANFMKLGVDIQHITDISTMEISEILMDENTLAIGFSISSGDEADPITKALKGAKERGAKTIMISSNGNGRLYEFCDEVVRIKVKKNKEIGHSISPKLPMMMMVEILYVHCLNLLYKQQKVVSRTTLT